VQELAERNGGSLRDHGGGCCRMHQCSAKVYGNCH
jgi:hypothetical protein